MTIGKKVIIFIIIISILLIAIVFVLNKKPHTAFSYTESAKFFSDNEYTIFFVKDARGPKGDGSELDVYSIYSDGSFEKKANPSVKNWPEESQKYGINESMGSYYGDTDSPNGDKKIVFEYPLGEWFRPFFSPTVYIEQNGQKKILPHDVLGELEWLSDNKRIIFSNGTKIGVINTESLQYAYLTNGVGWVVSTLNE